MIHKINFDHPDEEEDFTLLKDGQPCSHNGCLNHRTHPCEGCGRIAGKNKINGSEK